MVGVSSSNATHSSLVHEMHCTSTHVYTCTHKCHMNALIIAVERGQQKEEPNKLISQENAGLTSVSECTIAVRCHACGVTWLLLDKRYNALRMPMQQPK